MPVEQALQTGKKSQKCLLKIRGDRKVQAGIHVSSSLKSLRIKNRPDAKQNYKGEDVTKGRTQDHPKVQNLVKFVVFWLIFTPQGRQCTPMKSH